MKSIQIGSYSINSNTFTVTAGPCSIESLEQFRSIVNFLHQQEVRFIRGGIFKPRTNPKDFQGLGEKALSIIKQIKKEYCFFLVSEIIESKQIDLLSECVDVWQVGTRSMYNYELLKELGKTQKPILLKRGFSATLKEWISASEYILKQGNDQIIFCERGIRTFETAYRNTLDLNAVVYLKKHCEYPVWVDPSHATGDRHLVSAIAKASMVAGADGLLIETHNNPEIALSDGMQALHFDQFQELIKDLHKLSKAISPNKEIN